MGACDYCGTRMLFGGKKAGNLRFCNERCQQAGALLAVSNQVPEAMVQERIWQVRQGACPKCQGPGPVEVHTSHRVWSAFVLTSWSSRPHISCRSCGRKSQLGAAAFSLVLGWWGFPWGIVMTPVQVCRNLAGMLRSQQSSEPSPQLQKMVRMHLAASLLTSEQPRA